MIPNPVPELTFKETIRVLKQIKTSRQRDCWEFVGGKDHEGYGLFYFQNQKHRAHRVIWRIVKGPIPDGILVLHHCDNPICCNPDHLFLGDTQKNMTDMVEKKRSTFGERNWNAILQAEDVEWIRREYKPYHPCYGKKALAFRYGMSIGGIDAVIRRKSWKHI